MRTTILIEQTTRNELKTRGKKGETYDDVIKKLLEVSKNESSWSCCE